MITPKTFVEYSRMSYVVYFSRSTIFYRFLLNFQIFLNIPCSFLEFFRILLNSLEHSSDFRFSFDFFRTILRDIMNFLRQRLKIVKKSLEIHKIFQASSRKCERNPQNVLETLRIFPVQFLLIIIFDSKCLFMRPRKAGFRYE